MTMMKGLLVGIIVFGAILARGETNAPPPSFGQGVYRIDFRDSLIDSLKSTDMSLMVKTCPRVDIHYVTPSKVQYHTMIDPVFQEVTVIVSPTNGPEQRIVLRYDGTNICLDALTWDHGTHWVMDGKTWQTISPILKSDASLMRRVYVMLTLIAMFFLAFPLQLIVLAVLR